MTMTDCLQLFTWRRVDRILLQRSG